MPLFASTTLRRRTLSVSAMIVGALALSATPAFARAAAEEGESPSGADPVAVGDVAADAPELPGRPRSSIQFSTRLYGYHQLETDIDAPGDGAFEWTRLGADTQMRMRLSERVNMSFNVDYKHDIYDFSGASSLGDPWGNINTLDLGAAIAVRMDDRWSLFGGPTLTFSAENGADWGDAVEVGGVIGASYRFSPELSLGFGFGASTAIEDDAQFFPLIIVDWRISERLTLSSRTASEFALRRGVELIYDFNENWEMAAGVAWERDRFRLDDEGVAPEGVGENESTPLWVRLTYQTRPMDFSVIAGVNLGGELTLEDRDGDRVAQEDYDAAFAIGLTGRIRF